jgi:hypothetical protein
MLRAAFVVALTICTLALGASEQGFLGISIYIDGDQFIPNQKVKSVVINRLVAHSPAHKAGLQLDDENLEVDGIKISGSRMSEIRPLLDKRAGQTQSHSSSSGKRAKCRATRSYWPQGHRSECPVRPNPSFNRRPTTAGSVSPVRGTRAIFAYRAYAACLRGRR